MSLTPGTRIASYEIVAALGAGAMGEVYRARDTNLGRDVAIKVLPEEFAQDEERLQRFVREARLLAQLNHPGIAGVFGLETEGDSRFIVMELVDGETLGARIERGPVPWRAALEIAVQVADALDVAHEAGIVHRDLKPDNVGLTADDTAKLLDFGIGKPMNEELQRAVGSSQQMTQAGAILGTPTYICPEQFKGKPVDRRADIWAFGCLLYEMLTGAPAFPGETVGEIAAGVLNKEPDWTALPDNVPPSVERMIRDALQKDPRHRLRDIGEARRTLERLVSGEFDGAADLPASASDLPASPHKPWSPMRVAVAGVVGLAVAAAIALATSSWSSEAPTRERRRSLSIRLPPGLTVNRSIAISPDGETVAFGTKSDSGELHVYLRRLDEFACRKIKDSELGRSPFFSPDGRSVGFITPNGLSVTATANAEDAAPRSLVVANSVMAASWGEDDWVVYGAFGSTKGLMRVRSAPTSADEEPEVLTLLKDGEYAHVYPQHILGTRKVLFMVWAADGLGGARVLDLDSKEVQPLTMDGLGDPGRWAASGHIAFELGHLGLSVAPFQPGSDLAVDFAAAQQLLADVYHLAAGTRSLFALSETGVMAYVPGDPYALRLTWVQDDGTFDADPVLVDGDLTPWTGLTGRMLSLSRDGELLVVGDGGDIVGVDLSGERAVPFQVTRHPAVDSTPFLAGDDRTVIFHSNRINGDSKRWAIYAQSLETGAEARLLHRSENDLYSGSASRPENPGELGTIAFYEYHPDTGRDIWLLPPGSDAVRLVATTASERQPAISGDGAWIAYASDESGSWEIFVIAADGTRKQRISTGGGSNPRWGPLGTKLYFRRGRQVMCVPFTDGAIDGTPVQVFDAPNLGRGYALSADEKRLLVVQMEEAAIPNEIRIVTNYFDRIREVLGE